MTEIHNENYALIPHPTKPYILLLAEGDGWTLPRHHATEAKDLQQAIQAQLGLNVTLLGIVYDHFKNASEQKHVVSATENHSPHWSAPENARWVDRDSLADLSLSVPEHRAVLESWFDEVESGNIPAKRVPWARFGWFDQATAWIEAQIANQGYSISGPIEQAHVRIWSTVLRVPTTSGMLYFKASDPSFIYEPALTQALSAHWPGCIPRVIAIEQERTWILMKDGGQPLRNLLLVEDKKAKSIYLEKALSLYAKFQIETIAYKDMLLSLGCPDLRLHQLPVLFEQMIADTSVLLVERKGGISLAELAQLHNFTPQVQSMCDELASYNLPETLHHDDFHTNNILINEQGYVFFDWGDTGITHPFCSMFAALRSAKYRLQYDDDLLLRLRDAYLEPWTAYAPKEQLLAAFQLAQRLAILSRALTWYRIILHLEDRAMWEYEDAVPYWLKMFLTNEEPDEM